MSFFIGPGTADILEIDVDLSGTDSHDWYCDIFKG
jgi:hypothetical protein